MHHFTQHTDNCTCILCSCTVHLIFLLFYVYYILKAYVFLHIKIKNKIQLRTLLVHHITCMFVEVEKIPTIHTENTTFQQIHWFHATKNREKNVQVSPSLQVTQIILEIITITYKDSTGLYCCIVRSQSPE